MIEMGLIVGIALLLTLAKCSWRWKLWVLSNPVLMDVLIFFALLVLHWGTFSGVMVATIGAFACSCVLSLGRWALGYMDHGKYTAGYMDFSHKLNPA